MAEQPRHQCAANMAKLKEEKNESSRFAEASSGLKIDKNLMEHIYNICRVEPKLQLMYIRSIRIVQK